MRRLLLTVSLLISIPLTLPAQQRELGGKEHIQMGTERPLEEAFLHPSDAAKPIMIWQWMDGVVSKEGITADLEAFKAAGISGVQQFLVGGPMQTGVSDSTNAIGTDSWRQLMRHAILECQRLGLSFGTHNCPGWSSSAFPTVTPEYSMQRLTWSDTIVSIEAGMKPIALQRPETDNNYHYYRDIAAVAIPHSEMAALKSVVVLPDTIVSSLPKGTWHIYRFGHTTNGRTNHGTAPAGGVGLECDKMSREAVLRYWEGYPTLLLNLAGDVTGTTFQRLEIDSYEAGGQEWTKRMPEEFQKRRGYDLIPWLPTLAGKTIESKEATQRVRRDWQETVTDLFAENYYGYMSQLAHEHGLKLLVQPYGTGSSKPFNPINTQKIVRQVAADDPICAEFWAKPDWGWKDVPRVVSAARGAGHDVVWAEGFTCWPLHAWKDDPAALKAIADRAFCLGINRMMLHAAAQNPWPDVKPGMTFGIWGTWWSPGQTWWNDGAPKLFTYIARCQSLLQRGRLADNFASRNRSLTTDAEGLQWLHRTDGDADIYFLVNATDSMMTTTLSLPPTDKLPELWNPDTGEHKEAPAWQTADGKMEVALQLTERQSLFLIFRKATKIKGPGLTIPASTMLNNIIIDGTWNVSSPDFDMIQFDSLKPWDESDNTDVRYFSGTATYSKVIHIKKMDKKSRYLLDLGEVKNLATLSVNGVQVGVLWHPPFQADITNFIHRGDNELSVAVTNLWVNRMIGDEQEEDDVEWSEPFQFGAAPNSPGVGRFMKKVPEWLSKGLPRPSTRRHAVVSFKFYEKDAPLLRSGLMGPVVLKQVRTADGKKH